MSRQEALNTFTEGMIMDLNPLTTPNNILTDCLNGTILTYNDNEFVLQNDQGNYKLKNAKLKENFIPVAIKEYGNVLYIVAYNPIDKVTEIGSYPAPQSIFELSTPPEKEGIITPINFLKTVKYTDLQKDLNTFIFIDPIDTKLYFLNPNDKIRLTVDDTNVIPYQTLQFFILDENKQLVELKEFNASDYQDFKSID